MNEDSALQMILAHLLSQPAFRKFLEDATSDGQAPVKIVVPDGSGSLKTLDVKEILTKLLEKTGEFAVTDLTKSACDGLGESNEAHDKQSLVGVLALFLKGGMPGIIGGLGDDGPVTLRESIDNEWPW